MTVRPSTVRHRPTTSVATIAAAAVGAPAVARLLRRRHEQQWRDRLHHRLLPLVVATQQALASADPTRASVLLDQLDDEARLLLHAPTSTADVGTTVTAAVSRARQVWGPALDVTRLTVDPDLPRLGRARRQVLTDVTLEALTNVARHQPGAQVDVAVTRTAGGVSLSVLARSAPATTTAATDTDGPDPRADRSATATTRSAAGGYGSAALTRAARRVGGRFELRHLDAATLATLTLPARRRRGIEALTGRSRRRRNVEAPAGRSRRRRNVETPAGRARRRGARPTAGTFPAPGRRAAA